MTKLLSVLLLSAYACIISCNSKASDGKENEIDSAKVEKVSNQIPVVIDRDSILKIAEKTALTAYRDLSIYDVSAELKDGKWYVDYNLTDPQMLGGGPHFVISDSTGEILECRFEQ
ncbi:MAG: hypothetical protein KKD31_09325 [Bacteroidetes bacterium]|nr:hypothetical protein [Bacteroidota bacterium]